MRATIFVVACKARDMHSKFQHLLGRLLGKNARSVVITDDVLGIFITDDPNSIPDSKIQRVVEIPEYIDDEVHFAVSQLARVNQ